MSKVIDFLERMGQDADLRHAGAQQIAQSLSNVNISPELRAAIVDGDQAKMESLSGAKTNVCAIIFPADSEDDYRDNNVAKAATVG